MVICARRNIQLENAFCSAVVYKIFVYLKYYRPTTPSKRGRRIIKKNFQILKFRRLCVILRRQNGKITSGHQTLRSRGGANFNFFRKVDWNRTLLTEGATFVARDFDNYRTGHLGLIQFKNGAYSYILISEDTRVGSLIKTAYCCNNYTINLSWRVPLSSLPTKAVVNCIETRPGFGGKLVRAAGTGAKIIKKLEDNRILLQLPSKKLIKLNANVLATVGRVSNSWHKFEVYSKAGYSYILNKKPVVRGEAMNAVDHPHGGRTRGGVPRKNPWGRVIK